MIAPRPRCIAALLLWFFAGVAPAQITLTEGTNFSVDAAHDGRLAIDLLGGIWIVPAAGGVADMITTGLLPARRPRWSPAADTIVYQARTVRHDQLWLYQFADGSAQNISDGQFFDQHPDWHPGGERLVYSSDRRDSGFDLWELDLETRLSWRITDIEGDETEPAWSANGRDLVYIHRRADQWSVMLRRHGQTDQVLETSASRLSSPQWRPDGSLITFIRHADDGLSIDMIILSDPLLIRPFITGEDFFDAPVTWLDRQQLLYPANGVIRKRSFDSWTSATLPFRVTVSGNDMQQKAVRRLRELPLIDTPPGQLVIRTARLIDGIGGGYQHDLDIVIESGRIKAVEQRRKRPGSIVVDMGDLTTLPGYIDFYASLPAEHGEALGPLLLSYGVTTIIAEFAESESLNERWSGKQMPGPRVLRAADISSAQSGDNSLWLVTIAGDLTAGVERRSRVADWLSVGVPILAENWQVGLGSGATMLLGAESLPASPRGERYDDIQLANGATAMTIVSGLADARTPGLAALLQSRQAKLLDRSAAAIRRFTERPTLAAASSTVVLGSKPNGLPPGIALHAEFRALADAGLTPEQALRAAGINAANALGLGRQLGRIAPGSVADLVLVDGDPLANINDAQKIVAIVRNGRFYSTIGLIERAQAATNVE
ncbi:MAG: amidohydrolase family protein [Proteobacteria bacterium]|nr:amidohydrolase family protein [Pseudomonadota bacterium]